MSSLPRHRRRIIRDSVRIRSTPARLWDAWADPALIPHWFPDHASGSATPGGNLRWWWDNFSVVFDYAVHQAEPGRSLVLEGKGPSQSSDVLEVRLEREGEETVVTLVNSGFLEDASWDEEFEGVVSGWRGVLAFLRFYAEHHYGQPRTQFARVRNCRFQYEEVARLTASPEGLGRWLGAASIDDAGRWIVLTPEGRRLTGRPLVTTRTEIFYTFDEIDGVAGINAFGKSPDQRTLCLLVSSWLPPEQARTWDQLWEAAFERLARAATHQASA